MPVDGLPNPRVHRLCRGCGKWFNLDEGSMEFPPIRGPISWITVSAARATDQESLKRFVCADCLAQRRKRGSAFIQALVALAVIAAVVEAYQLGWFAFLGL